MSITQRLDLRQSQSLVMTPQLQQAIKLLQLSNVELTAFVEAELEQNPMLSRAEEETPETRLGGIDYAPADSDGAAADPGDGFGDAPGTGDAADFAARSTAPEMTESPLDTDYDNTYTSDAAIDRTGPEEPPLPGYAGGGLAAGRGGSFEDDDRSLEQTLSGETSLRDHLERQIGLDITDGADRLIALQLMELLDDAGYLTGDLAAVAVRLGCDGARVEAVLARLQQFEPAGIFARSLAECLAIQLRERNRLDPAMQALLDNLPLLARRDADGLRQACGVDAEDLSEMVAEIRALNPRPAAGFDDATVEAVTPDILMRARPDGTWVIDLNPDTLPRVLFDRSYHAEVNGKARNKQERDYIAERSASASWLVKSLDQRATTILKVATEIVRQQDGFFRQGVAHLRPLILRDIAEAISMHESTVSRVTTNKYMATPVGTFELKYFFTAAIPGADGAASHSAEAVRYRIKALIDGETAATVLSDDRIVDLLRADGIDIARRTVAKYRESMRIASSVQRRREKMLSL